MEVLRGLILTVFAIFCGFHRLAEGDSPIYVPGCLVVIFPILSATVLLMHRVYYNRLLANKNIASDFALEIK
jgi:hypothetical protein